MARRKRSSLRWRMRSCARRNFVRGGDDIQAALIKHDRVRLDFSLLRVFAGRLILGLHDAPLENRPVDRAQDAVLPLVAFGGHAADVEHLAIGFVVLPDRSRQLVLQLAPERFDARARTACRPVDRTGRGRSTGRSIRWRRPECDRPGGFWVPAAKLCRDGS